jgi:hypothetical protein
MSLKAKSTTQMYSFNYKFIVLFETNQILKYTLCRVPFIFTPPLDIPGVVLKLTYPPEETPRLPGIPGQIPKPQLNTILGTVLKKHLS